MWEPVLSLSHVSDTPLFLQIAHAVTDAIQAGQLRSGERLPGSRSLARQLGVHRNTVLTAYAELEAQGWLCTEQARGTFVSGDIPDRAHQEAVAATQAWSLSTPPQQQAGFTLP
ncbi:MAG: winged helix-turn-helix domain-containing protein, partial [Myxococcota bacterium]